MVAAMAHDESSYDPSSPRSDLAFDWISVVKSKAEALLRRLHDQDAKALAEAKQHLTQVLSGKMGAARGRADDR